MTILTGFEALRESGFELIAGRRIGLLTNPSAVTHDLHSTYELMRRAPEFELAALFSAEHGFAGAAADGAHVATTTDPRSGVPVYSLYDTSFEPTHAMLSGLDTIVCDLQDIGVRFYTYAWTMTHLIEAAGAASVEVVVLDRPNPLGSVIDGPLVEPGYESLVGRFPVPVQHGMTMGELARMVNALWNPNATPLLIVNCQNYRRDMTWEETGLPFVPTSPAMAHLSAVRQYPGACLLEGTSLSEGRGTALPFEICGAPYIDEEKLATHLNAQGWPGVRFRPHVFQPSARKYAGKVCRGVQAHVTGPAFNPLRTWLGVIREIRHLYPDKFEWLAEHFDRLAGNAAIREQIDAGASLAEIVANWDETAALFHIQRAPFLLYT
ncbi:MAG: DUF1343 domain-containing protein [Anaerolineae bacterium]|nr:DUF1343 domain-containing protein [Anaerolineae bacterium]